MSSPDDRRITQAYQFTKETAISFGDWWESRKNPKVGSAEPKPHSTAERRICDAA